MSQTYDVIVLGAGIMGSAAAYYLAKTGQRVLLLEQFEIDHQKGSSYGYSRIIRYAYDHPVYVELARAAYPLWSSIEAESGETLYTKTGGIDFGPSNDEGIAKIMSALQECHIPYEVLSTQETQERFPQFHLDDNSTVLYQADTGILAASKCVRAHVVLTRKLGATILPNTPIIKIVPLPHSVEVHTQDAVYNAGEIVITAGSWAKSVLAQLGLNLSLMVQQCQEIYFDTMNPEDYQPDRFPAFIAHIPFSDGRMAYGMASQQNSGLKTAFHGGRKFDHPSQVNYTPDNREVEEGLRFLHQYIPAVTNMRSTRICLYTTTPDENFLIDKHPEYSHVIFAGGFSGHGFKFGTLVGKILSDLTLKGTTEHDISLFQVSRFL
jgi:sarcosine oxidase